MTEAARQRTRIDNRRTLIAVCIVIATLGAFQVAEARYLARLLQMQIVQSQRLTVTSAQVRVNEQMIGLLREATRLDDEQNKLVLQRLNQLEDVMKRRGVIFGEGDLPRIEVPRE